MDRFEMTEKLREKAQVSYEEARAALEQNNWDLVDAIVFLEKQGQMKREEPKVQEERKAAQPRRDQPKGNVVETVVAFIGSLVEKGNRNHVEIYRNGERQARPSLLVALLLALVFPWIVLPAVVISLVLGVSFRLTGPDMPQKKRQEEQQAEPAAE